MVAIANAVMGGIVPPLWPTGIAIKPHYCVDSATALTTTATRLYYLPIYLPRIETFAGAKTFNSGAGDNAETYRVGIYGESSSGGPGTLLKDIGEVTLTGAAALRTTASSFTNTAIGWHYLAVHHNTAAAMKSFVSVESLSAAGQAIMNPIAALLGSIETTGQEFGNYDIQNVFPYVDTAYGALASTAVAPTTATNRAPGIRLYK